jgi:two-component system response regulator NreC
MYSDESRPKRSEVRVVLVDDHLLFREGLKTLLVAAGGFEIVGEASEARAAYKVVEEQIPDVVIVDVTLPGTNGIAVTRELIRRRTRSRVLMLTMHESESFAREALQAGAVGYALKSQSVDQIVNAVRTVAAGQSYLAPPFAQLATTGRALDGGGPLDRLSPREREIFDLVVRGFSTSAIAAELCISQKTVEAHRSHINKKLSVHSSAEVLRYAVRHALV